MSYPHALICARCGHQSQTVNGEDLCGECQHEVALDTPDDDEHVPDISHLLRHCGACGRDSVRGITCTCGNPDHSVGAQERRGER